MWADQNPHHGRHNNKGLMLQCSQGAVLPRLSQPQGFSSKAGDISGMP